MSASCTDPIIGSGHWRCSAPVRLERQLIWPGGAAQLIERDFSARARFEVLIARHMVVFSLRGFAFPSDVRVDGRGVPEGLSHVGEFWFLPAGHEVRCEARGGCIRNLELFFDPDFVAGLVGETANSRLRGAPAFHCKDALCCTLGRSLARECMEDNPSGIMYLANAALLISMRLLLRPNAAHPDEPCPDFPHSN